MTETTPTEEIPVHIYLCLDRSGSMDRIRTDVVGGYNRFLREQKAKPGKCRLTLVQFDDAEPFELVHDAVKIADVPELTEDAFVPRGATPLLDAEGRLIARVEERQSKRKANSKPPEAVIFVTFTDGFENASLDWDYTRLSAKKKEHEDDWAFIYLGVGHDAYGQSNRIGTQSVNTMSATRDSAGTQIAYDYFVGEVDNVRDRASRGLHTNSGDTVAAQQEEPAAKDA